MIKSDKIFYILRPSILNSFNNFKVVNLDMVKSYEERYEDSNAGSAVTKTYYDNEDYERQKKEDFFDALDNYEDLEDVFNLTQDQFSKIEKIDMDVLFTPSPTLNKAIKEYIGS